MEKELQEANILELFQHKRPRPNEQATLVLPFMKVKVDNARVRYDGILRYGSLQPYSKNIFLFNFCELRHQVGFTLLLIRNIITNFLPQFDA